MKHSRKIIVHINTNADGFIPRPDGNVAWLDRPRPKGHYGVLEGLLILRFQAKTSYDESRRSLESGGRPVMSRPICGSSWKLVSSTP